MDVVDAVLDVLRVVGGWMATPAAAPWRAALKLRGALRDTLVTLQVRWRCAAAVVVVGGSGQENAASHARTHGCLIFLLEKGNNHPMNGWGYI